MSRRSISSPFRIALSMTTLMAGVTAPLFAQTPTVPAVADSATEYLVKGLIKRRLSVPAPAGTDAIRVSVLGDSSGAKVQIRLLSPTSSAVGGVEAYYVSPDLVLDYSGWKTVILPLSQFTFRSDQNPETDGSASTDTLFALLPIINTIQVAVTASPTAKVFLDEMVWTTAVAGQTDPPLRVIDDFEATASSWYLTGDYEQLKATQVAQNRTAAYVKNGQGSLQVTVRPAELEEKQLYAPALTARLKKQTTQPYAAYIRPAFQPIRPNSAPSPQEAGAVLRLDMTACAGEIEPTTFSVFSATDLKNVTVKAVGPFRSESGQSEMPLSAINVQVVRVGDGRPRTDLTAPLSELLMKDDRQSLEGDLPAVRLTGDPLTDIPASSSKQFWITVTVPKNQVNSLYSGQIVFSAEGVKSTTIPFRINVLPIQLRTAFLQYGMDLHSRLSPESEGTSSNDKVVTPETYSSELKNVGEHGFKIVTLDDSLAALPKAFDLYRQAGLSLSGPVVINTPLKTGKEIQQVEALRGTAGLGSGFEIYYRVPTDLTEETSAGPLGDYVKMVRKATNNRALLVAPVASRAKFEQLSPVLNSSVFAPVFAASSDYTSTLVATGKREFGNHDYWLWNIPGQNPLRNRLLSGYLLYRTGSNSSPLYGAFANPIANTGASAAFYPVQGGVVDTIQWEAVREGIDDIRYFGALKNYIRDMKDRQLRKDLTTEADNYVAAAIKKPLWALTPAEYQKLRVGMIDQALKLLRVIRSSVPTYPG